MSGPDSWRPTQRCKSGRGGWLEPYKSKNKGWEFWWWQRHASEFPMLAPVARRALSVLASSAPAESLFSLAGNIITKNRCSLNPAVAQDLIFLSANRAHWGLADLALVCEDADYGDAPDPADQ